MQDHVRGKPHTVRTLSLTTEVLLKSRDIIESFGYSEKDRCTLLANKRELLDKVHRSPYLKNCFKCILTAEVNSS